jgi:hypothetical protein
MRPRERGKVESPTEDAALLCLESRESCEGTDGESLACFAVSIGAVAFLTSCGAPTPPVGALGAARQTPVVARRATNGDLLYAITTGNKYVYAVTYPTITLVNKLGPFSNGGQLSLCVDSTSGNVYVLDPGANYAPGEIYIYQHGSTSPIRMLPAPRAASNCAVDPASADLAVLTHDGQLAIYRHSRGTAHQYSLASDGPSFCAYGDSGNLYIVGNRPGPGDWFGVFVRGTLHDIVLYERIRQSVRIQWHSGSVVATTLAEGWPQDYHQEVYSIKPEASYKTHMRSFAIDRRKSREEPNRTTAFWVQGDTLVAPDHDLGALDFWKYPQGGDPQRSARLKSADGYFIGIVVSR